MGQFVTYDVIGVIILSLWCFFSCIHSLYALLSKKHAKVMEHIKQAESSPQENTEGARHNDYVGIL